MNFRELADSADDIIIDAFAEEATINGTCVSVIVNDDPIETPSLDVPVESRVVFLTLRTHVAKSLALTKGMPVDFRDQAYRVRDFVPDNYGFTRIEMGA